MPTNYGKPCANIMLKELLLIILVSYSTILLIKVSVSEKIYAYKLW